MNNFNFVSFIYLIILLQTTTLHFYLQTFPLATVLPKMNFLEYHVVPWLNKWRIGLGFMGEQGAKSIHAAVRPLLGLTPAYQTRSLRCIGTPLPSVFSSPDISLYKAVIEPFIHFHSYYCNAGAKQDTLTIIQLTINGCSRMRCPWRHTLRSSKS